MEFLLKVKNSIYSPEFYKSLLTQKLSFGLKYFLLLALIFSLIQAVIPVKNLANGTRDLPKQIQNLASKYPSELAVKITNGRVSTNVKEPYLIGKDTNSSVPSSFMVIDTKTSYTRDQFDKYNTLFWLTKDSLFYKTNSNGTEEVKSYDLSGVDSLTVNRKAVNSLSQKAMPYLKLLTPILMLFLFLGLILAYLFRLIYVLFLALLVFLVGKIFKWNFSYKTAYLISLFALTLTLIFEVIQSAVNLFVQTQGFPFMGTIIALLIVIVNFWSLNKTEINSTKSHS